MKVKNFLCLCFLFVLTGCNLTINLNSSDSVSNKGNVKEEHKNISKSISSNVITTRVPKAEKVPKQYYQYLNEKNMTKQVIYLVPI